MKIYVDGIQIRLETEYSQEKSSLMTISELIRVSDNLFLPEAVDITGDKDTADGIIITLNQ